jgi:hypothetical protein
MRGKKRGALRRTGQQQTKLKKRPSGRFFVMCR